MKITSATYEHTTIGFPGRVLKWSYCPRSGHTHFYTTLHKEMQCAPHHPLPRPHDTGDLDRYLAAFDGETRRLYADDITVQG